jgi:hypothetical protein
MEQSEGFKSVDSKLKSLEQQLSLCDKTIKDFEQSGKDAEQEIEEHFARCMNSLAARKAVLLKDVKEVQPATSCSKSHTKVSSIYKTFHCLFSDD